MKAIWKNKEVMVKKIIVINEDHIDLPLVCQVKIEYKKGKKIVSDYVYPYDLDIFNTKK